ncbi:MAG: class I SAM-dependent methyltransferase [Anaerolineae bacterium]
MGGLIGLWWKLIGFGFRLLYNEMAWTYDLVSRAVSLGRWRLWQRAAIAHLGVSSGDRVLELAHGTGDLQIDLAAAGLDPIGVDISPAMGRIAARKLRRAGLPPQLVRADARHLPFADGSFKAVVSTFPTPFIIEPETLHEAARVLVPGGRLVIVVAGLLTLRSAPARFLEWLYQITGQRSPWPGDVMDVFDRCGFDARVVEEEQPGSRVMLVIASRRP